MDRTTLCGRMYLWLYVFMVVWFYGYMVLWLYGYTVFFLRENAFIKIKTGRSRQDSLDRPFRQDTYHGKT